MDPQAVFTQLLEAMDRGDDDTLDAMFQALLAHLRDGRRPIVTCLGYDANGRRRFLSDSSGNLCIQTVDLGNVPIFEFVLRDDESGEIAEKYPLISG